MPPKKSPEQYLQKCRVVHGERYTYDTSTFCRSADPVQIHCPDHGWFSQKLLNHLNGAGCPKCAGRGVDWVARFREVHGFSYDYSRVNYKGYKSKVEVICPEHGSFWQTPDNHYRGRQGCPKCGNLRIRKAKQMPLDDFLVKASRVHGGKYTYEHKQFNNMLTDRVWVKCPDHGWFQQTPVNHLAGKVGCPRCNHMKSKPEQALADFLSLFTTVVQRDRTIIAPKEIDIYLPELNLAVEYCGMYWHSHKDQEDERKNKRRHAEKHRMCAEKGIRLITIYESEWLARPQTVLRLLRAATGNLRGRLMARKCELRTVTNAEARAFYDKYHPQGGAGHGHHYALFWRGRMVACMRFTMGNNDRGSGAKNRQWTLSRYATRLSVAGAAGRLFKAFVKDHNPDSVKSFSDNRLFSGGMYEKLGFILEEEVAPDYQVWSPKIGLKPKPHYQRRQLPKRLEEHGVEDQFDPKTDPRTEAQMTYLMGAGRIYDCGKKRWLWTPPQT